MERVSRISVLASYRDRLVSSADAPLSFSLQISSQFNFIYFQDRCLRSLDDSVVEKESWQNRRTVPFSEALLLRK